VQTWHEGCSIRQLPDLIPRAMAGGGLVVVRPNYREVLHPSLAWAVRGKSFRIIPNASSIPRSELDAASRATLRAEMLRGCDRLVLYFGFILPHKGAELVFDIADPSRDFVCIVGEAKDPAALEAVARRMAYPEWRNRSELLGFVDPGRAADLLSVADAVVLPFRDGGGEWNSSLHAVRLQGTFSCTTSLTRRGYDADSNTFFAPVGDVEGMRAALGKYVGARAPDDEATPWKPIASAHLSLYRELMK
jgi:hypothetical protein